MIKMRKRRKQTKAKLSRKKFFWQQGDTTLYLLFAIVAIGAFLLVGGVYHFPFSQTNQTSVGDIITQAPGSTGNQLQLNDLKFKACTGQLNIDLLLDRSGSMGDPTASGVSKISALKSAVHALANGLEDTSLIGIQSFDSGAITNDVPVSYYKDVKSQVSQAIDALTPGNLTPTHDALVNSYNQLLAAKSKYPGKKLSFIFVTDGLPCPGVGCVGLPGDQDPRKYNPNPADQIKAAGVTIYTIGVHAPADGTGNNFAPLLKSIASTPDDYYEAPTGDEITKLLSDIKTKICNTAATPTTTQ